MQITLTGARGFVGSCLDVALRRAGHTVNAIEGELEAVRGTIGGDVLVHAAGAIRGSRRSLWSANVTAFEHMLERLAPDVRVVALSSRAVYAPAPAQAVAEDHELRPADAYGAAKLAAERTLAATKRAALTLRATVLVGVAPNGRLNASAAVQRMVETASLGAPIVCHGGGQSVDFLDVWELVEAVERLIVRDDAWGRTLNIAGPQVALDEWVTAVACELGTPVEHTPAATPPTLLDCGRLDQLLGWRPTRQPSSIISAIVRGR
ncbi:MAG: SDR family oxidoreductase [Pseudomonadota bacterium]|nr:SDR family oxidoreductase [Pseudomonadota bacterium]